MLHLPLRRALIVAFSATLMSLPAWGQGVNNPPTSLPPNGPAGGDLSGTYPNPGVAKVQGDANVSFLDVNQSYTKGQAVTPTAGGSVSGTVTPDASTANDFSYTLTGNITLANPTNLKAGQTLNFALTQDSGGSHTIAFGSQYQAPGGTAGIVLTTTGSATDFLSCRSISTSVIYCGSLLANVKH